MVVATHRNLEEQVRQGTFREDLYHRVFVFPIVLPPLRERREDIRVLAEHFARQLAEQNNWKPKSFAPEAIEALESYAWPGNVRELRNVIERVLLLTPGDVVERRQSGARCRKQVRFASHASPGDPALATGDARGARGSVSSAKRCSPS